MAWKRARKSISAVLRGNGLDSKCIVRVEDVRIEGIQPGYCRVDITWVDKPLPDGDYELDLGREIVDVRLSYNSWLAPLI